MNEHILLLLILVGFHFVCDYPLQGDFVAKFKARIVDGNKNQIWKWVLTAHASIHALPVLILTSSIPACLFLFATHFLIDFLKCENKINLDQDQILHLLVITLISFFVYLNPVFL